MKLLMILLSLTSCGYYEWAGETKSSWSALRDEDPIYTRERETQQTLQRINILKSIQLKK